MTRGRRDERASRAEEIFKARVEAQMARAMSVRERATAAAKLGRGKAERAMEAVERRVADVLRRDRGRRPDIPSKEDIRRRWGRRRPGEEGGEPMPAIPRPKPKPLAGAAAAEIE